MRDLGFTKAFGQSDPRFGIMHVVGPETGLSQPGMVLCAGDSHTCTHGAMGLIEYSRLTPGEPIEMTVDLKRQVVERPGMAPVPFRIDARRRASLLQGLDTTLLERLQHGESAEAMREGDRRLRPWTYNAPDRRDP